MASPEPSDARLIRAVAAGSEAALAQLYDRYAQAIYHLALRVVRQPAEAEEIVQETWLRVWRAAPAYEGPPGALAPWLFRIARNLALDQLRRRQARPAVDEAVTDAAEGAGLGALADPKADVPDAAWASVRREQVRRALGELPAAQRQALELAYFEGLTHREIAAHLNEPLGTVKTRLRLGLQKLALIFRDQGWQP